MNLRNTLNMLMTTGAAAAYYAPDGVEGGAGGDVADPSLLADAGAVEQTPEEKAAAAGAVEKAPEELAAEAAAAEAAKGEPTDEEKAAAEAARAAPFEGLEAPEGFEALDADLLALATPLMRDQGIDTPEKAQAFVNAFAPVLGAAVEKATTAAAAAQQEAISTEIAGWVQQSKAKHNGEAMADAARFRDRFVTSEAGKALIREAPIFNHPEVIDIFVNAGKALAQDQVINSDLSAQTAPKTLGGALFGDMKPVAPE